MLQSERNLNFLRGFLSIFEALQLSRTCSPPTTFNHAVSNPVFLVFSSKPDGVQTIVRKLSIEK